MSPETTQLCVIALAHLAVERPGWYDACRHAAATEYGEGTDGGLFDRFYLLHRERAQPPTDGVLQLKDIVQRTNPVLWEMVREIAWPGGQS